MPVGARIAAMLQSRTAAEWRAFLNASELIESVHPARIHVFSGRAFGE
jgi:hypothetical protein